VIYNGLKVAIYYANKLLGISICKTLHTSRWLFSLLRQVIVQFCCVYFYMLLQVFVFDICTYFYAVSLEHIAEDDIMITSTYVDK